MYFFFNISKWLSLNEAEYLVTKAYASHDFMDKIVSIGNVQINSLSFYAVT